MRAPLPEPTSPRSAYRQSTLRSPYPRSPSPRHPCCFALPKRHSPLSLESDLSYSIVKEQRAMKARFTSTQPTNLNSFHHPILVRQSFGHYDYGLKLFIGVRPIAFSF